MKCKKFEDAIVLDLYGELSRAERLELEAHLSGCESCAAEMRRSREVFDLLNEAGTVDIPETDWERNWARIRTRIRPGSGRAGEPKRPRLLHPGWVYAAAAVSLVFILGLFTARYWSPFGQPRGAVSAGPIMTPEAFQFKLDRHIEDIKPVLVEYANAAGPENGSATITLDKEMVQQLIIQNILLARLIAERDPSAEQLLEDVDMVLREIANSRKDDTTAATMIRDIIRERDILFKLETAKSF